MRLCLPVLLLAALSAPADAATRNFGVSGFDRIRVDGPFKVRLATGVAPYARAEGSPAAIERVAMEVRGRTLVVSVNRSSWGGYPGADAGPVEIHVGTHELDTAWLNGAGSLAINAVSGLSFDLSVQGSGAAAIDQVRVDQLKVNINGMASASLAGEAGMMTALVRGISALNAGRLAIKDATIGTEGPATVQAHVTNTAKVDGTGTGSVTLSGNPACTARMYGSSTVSGCR